jgi:hypothetical protein
MYACMVVCTSYCLSGRCATATATAHAPCVSRRASIVCLSSTVATRLLFSHVFEYCLCIGSSFGSWELGGGLGCSCSRLRVVACRNAPLLSPKVAKGPSRLKGPANERSAQVVAKTTPARPAE